MAQFNLFFRMIGVSEAAKKKPKINRNQSDLFEFDEMKQLFMYINILRTYPVVALKSLFQNCILDVVCLAGYLCMYMVWRNH